MMPKHWRMKRLKYVSHVNRNALSETTDESYDFNYVDISNVAIGKGFNIQEKINFANAPSRARRIVRGGDTIISTVRTYLKAIAYFEGNVKDVIVSTGFAVISPNETIAPKYLYYILRSEAFIERVCALSVGVSYPAINSAGLADIVIWYPDDVSEQKRIVAHLDDKTAQIDDLIAKKERMIELLEEERAAAINQAVTRGLDANVELKDSGVEWLGKVPKHWEIHPVKYHYDVQLGKMLQNTSLNPPDQLVPYLKALHVHWNRITVDDLPEMWAGIGELSQYGVKDGDLLVCEGGEVGRAGIVHNPPKNCIIQNALHRVRAKNRETLIAYLLYVMYVINASEWFSILCNKATIAHFTREKFIDLQIPIPPRYEQERIIDFLDNKTTQIDAQVARERRSVELLKEYRTALISEVVTGKIDVRNEVNDETALFRKN